MRVHQRGLCALLTLALLASLLLPGGAAQAVEDGPAVTGSISATLRIDYAQSLEQIRAREVRARLYQNGEVLGELALSQAEENARVGAYPAQVVHRNTDGGELGGGAWPGYLDLTIEDLPQGSYELEFLGEGYVPFRMEVELDQYARHVLLGTGDATFTLGDVNGDGRVTQTDRDGLAEALGGQSAAELSRYDLNGDGAIDIVDLAYVSRQLNAQGDAEQLDTVLLATPLDEPAMTKALQASGTRLEGTAADLFLDNGRTVKLSPAQEGGAIILTIPLEESVPMSQLRLITPEGAGAVKKGTVVVEDAAGNQSRYDFDNTRDPSLLALSTTPGANVITISLGARVAVKKVTVTVTQTEGGEYAVLELIQFLKDIVPENPVAPNSEIRNLSADPGDGQVVLSWQALPNVSGYQVEYQLAHAAGAPTQVLYVDVPQATVSGLENLKAYVFTVTPTDGSWKGKPSVPVTATPEPAKAPDSPDMVQVTALDGALNVSWKEAKNATYYEVYYTDQEGASVSSYRQAGGRLAETRTTLDGLENGVTYYLYVIAGNDMGRSGPSKIHSGTPEAVKYERPEGIPEGTLDYQDIERVWLAMPSNYSHSSYTESNPFRPENMADGDYSTHWTSQAWGDGNWWNNKQVLCSFREPQSLSAVIWVPRLDRDYPSNLRLYTVTVWTQGQDLSGPGTQIAPNSAWGGTADHNTWPSVRNDPAVTKFAVLPFEPVENVVQIAITIEQVGYSAVSLSELMFLPYDKDRDLPGDIAALFADTLYTQLNPGVTQEQIDQLRARLNSEEGSYYLYPDALKDELDLAAGLLSGESAGVILNGVDSRSSGRDSSTYGQGGSDLQPLGAAAGAGEEITIYVEGIPDGEQVQVYASQYHAEASAWRASMGTLQNGRNVFRVPQIGSEAGNRGGSLYFTYSGSRPEDIRIHVRRATAIPVLDLSGWYEMDETARRSAIRSYAQELADYVAEVGINDNNKLTDWRNSTEIATPSVLLSLPAAAVLGNIGKSGLDEQVDTLYDTVLAWEDVMHICKTTQGISGTYENNAMESRQNIRCMTMFFGAFMYAAGNHIGIGYGSCGGMVCGKPISQLEAGAAANQLFGWGIIHEIGHNMDKLGKAEITNNLYSLMVQTYDGDKNILSSRLERSNKYPAIFTKVAQGYPGASNDVFVQLGLYWQLHLAYDGAGAPMDFYHRFFQAWKAGTYFDGAAAYDDKVALTAAGVAQRDLTEFFTRWGMTLSESTQTALSGYTPENRAIWYLDDGSRRDALAGMSPAAGTVAVHAALQGDNQIVLTITPSITGEIQGYEIRRNGVSIGFTAGTTYTDTIGSGNHRTYEYTVAAYDTLGNEIAVGDTEQIRVAYDKLVDTSAYTLTRQGTTVTFTFAGATPISGLKLMGENRPTSGSYTITISTPPAADARALSDSYSVTADAQIARMSEDAQGKTVTARIGTFDSGNLATDDSYLTYFNKPGTAGTDDTRIWTYDAITVTVTGIPEAMSDDEIRLVSYAEDDISFLEGGAVGLLGADLQVGDEVIPAGTLVVVGNYRGDPVFCTIKIKGRFTQTAVSGDDTVAEDSQESYLEGDTYLFAAIPEDQQVSDISDGLFLFVPKVQKEEELEEGDRCNGVNVLPSQIQAEIARTDDPNDASSQHTTAVTLWIHSPGGTELPTIVVEGGTR